MSSSLIETEKKTLKRSLERKLKQYDELCNQIDLTLPSDAEQKMILQERAETLWTEIQELEKKLLPNLHQALVDNFSSDALGQTCHELGISYDSLSGETKAHKVRELVLFVEREKKVQQLVNLCQRGCPDINWDKLLADYQKRSTDNKVIVVTSSTLIGFIVIALLFFSFGITAAVIGGVVAAVLIFLIVSFLDDA